MFLLESSLASVEQELTMQLKLCLELKKKLSRKKSLEDINGSFLPPALLAVWGEAECWSIALVSHCEGIPEVSGGPLICELHCPNSLCLLFYLSPSVPLDPSSQQALLA